MKVQGVSSFEFSPTQLWILRSNNCFKRSPLGIALGFLVNYFSGTVSTLFAFYCFYFYYLLLKFLNFYSWVFPVFFKSLKKDLEIDDLYRCSRHDEASVLVSAIDRFDLKLPSG